MGAGSMLRMEVYLSFFLCLCHLVFACPSTGDNDQRPRTNFGEVTPHPLIILVVYIFLRIIHFIMVYCVCVCVCVGGGGGGGGRGEGCVCSVM